MSGHDYTPNPKGAQPSYPVPLWPQRTLPDDRSDETRDAAATGV